MKNVIARLCYLLAHNCGKETTKAPHQRNQKIIEVRIKKRNKTLTPRGFKKIILSEQKHAQYKISLMFSTVDRLQNICVETKTKKQNCENVLFAGGI